MAKAKVVVDESGRVKNAKAYVEKLKSQDASDATIKDAELYVSQLEELDAEAA